MKHVHESPLVMTRAADAPGGRRGACRPGLLRLLHRPGRATSSGRSALSSAPRTTSSKRCTTSPFWVKILPFLVMALGFCVAVLVLHALAGDAARSSPQRHDALYQFLLNKWYFDELYDFLFVRPAMWLGRFLWKQGDGWLIDGLGPDGVSARVLDVTARVVRLQSGYLYHYAFAMLIGVAALITWAMFAGGAAMMTGWPILSTVTFLPLVGALLILIIRGDDDIARRNIYSRRARGRRSSPSSCRSSSGSSFDPSNPGFQFVEKHRLARRHASATDGRRRHLDAVRRADRVPDAVLHPRELADGQSRLQGIHDRLPGARDADDRRLLRRSISRSSTSSSRAA